MESIPLHQFFGNADKIVSVAEGLTVSIIRHDRGLVIPPHRHELPRLCFVLSGSFEENDGEGFREYPAGWMLYWTPDCVHEDRFGDGMNITLQIEMAGAALRKLEPLLPQSSPSPIHLTAFDDAVPRLLQELHRNDAATTLALEGAVYELVARAARLWGRKSSIYTREVRCALDYLATHEGDAWNVRDIAAAAGVSISTLNRRFHAELGQSVTEHIRQHRLHRAEGLLRATNRSMAEIAVQSGYYDPAHMTREFRALLGMTPTAYRRYHNAGGSRASNG